MEFDFATLSVHFTIGFCLGATFVLFQLIQPKWMMNAIDREERSGRRHGTKENKKKALKKHLSLSASVGAVLGVAGILFYLFRILEANVF